MFDAFRHSTLRERIGRRLLAIDAWLTAAFYHGGVRWREAYNRFATFMDRFHAAGWKRWLLEFTSEGVNIGMVGLLTLLALALPAFELTSDPNWLNKQDLAVTFLDRYGNEVGKRGIRHDDSVPLDQFPDYFLKAVIATEDRRFYDHFGIDVIGTIRALTVNASSNTVVQGGSSITQQLAKNLFLSNERSLTRKINEAFIALWLEWHFSKREILKLYLDRAYMGGGAFGAEAAAEFYFGKSIKDVNLAEAAMLAGLFKAPTKYAPHANLPAARARASDVLDFMVDAGFLTAGQVYAARKNPATPVDRKIENMPDWYLDFAFNEVKQLSLQGKLRGYKVLTVRTGLDMALQAKTESVLEDMLRMKAPAYHAHEAAAVVAETDGLVRAMVGGRDYGESQFNRATDAQRQPGSSFKIFVYLTALLTNKYHKDTVVDASGICIGDYCVNNYHGESAGRLPLYKALAESLNTAAIRMSVKIGEVYWPKDRTYNESKIATLGRNKIVETARLLGVTTPLIDTVSLPVGADEVKMIDMVGANAVLASGGKHEVPHAAVEIRNSSGAVVYTFAKDGPKPDQVIPADKATEMVDIMTHVVTEGTGRAAQIEGIPAAGKTGTTNNSTNAWFNGFTGNLVCSVWFGNDDNTSMDNMTGGTLPAQSWHEIMTFAHQSLDLKPLPGKPPISVNPLAAASASATDASQNTNGDTRIVTLSRGSIEAIDAIGRMMGAKDAAPSASVAPAIR